MERDIGWSANYKICFILKLNYCFKSLRHKCKTNLNLCMTKIHWNQIIHIHQNTSVYKPKIYWFLHDQSSLGSIHDHLSSFFSHFNVDTKQFCIEISCYFMNQNYGSLKRLFLKFDISFMFAQCAWNEFAHIHTQFFFHLITCLEQSKFVKANVLDQYDKETEIFF